MTAYGLISGPDSRAIMDRGRDFRGWRFDEVLNRAHIPGLRFEYAAQDKKEFKNIVEYNSKGLNDYEYDYRKPDRSLRVLVFGDSFVEAIQVRREENFCKLMEHELNGGDSSKEYEVINMGVSGYSPILEYLYLKYEGMKYAPDMVVECFFVNDVYEDYIYGKMARFDERGLPIAVSSGGFDKTKGLKGWKRVERKISTSFKGIVNKSKFYTFIKNRFYKLLTLLKMREMKESENQFSILRDGTTPDKSARWEETFRYIAAMKALSEKNGARFLMVVIPIEAQVSGDLQNAAFRAYFTAPPDSGHTNNMIRSLSGKNGIETVNLFDDFKAMRGEGLYFKNDGHFTPKGHEAASRLILEKLRSLGWIGGEVLHGN